ncbi:uroporphyrinogen-III synthase [Crossiella equi]|uniref:Uroporphyrinogen-III synthase n=1 Tax=Crossiella equi TaxID=130796 RepID=A0ABS5AJ08_9PSEU|nr:uroporphyrinogen-III synthase [Crossiella equi]MBP2476555.1 uroporphyrinogen-III synthase [Crossiella equi]
MNAELAGFTVGLTAARRAEELAALLERRGAAVLHAPAIRILPLADDADLLAATREVLAQPLDVVVATTAIGFRGWLEAAEGWGLAADLRARFASATVLARGPKARGAVRAAGLVESFSPASESNADLLAHLLATGVAGKRVAVQEHGAPVPEFVEPLRAAGAEVVPVSVYRWERPVDLAPLDRLLDAVRFGQLDALAFTSAPAAANLLAHAEERGRRRELVDALREEVLVACVGGITAAPLVAAGIPVVSPERGRIGALARHLGAELAARAPRLRVAGRSLELRGQAVLVDGEYRPVAPAPMAVLRALVRRCGKVASRAELLGVLPSGGEEHAVETAVGRLRTALGEPRMIQTVVKRGYRVPLETAR